MNNHSTLRPLTTRDFLRFHTVADPQVSPDGRNVAWVRTWQIPDENRYQSHIYITALPDGGTRRLTQLEASESNPRWSPDGRHVAFLTAGEAGGPGASAAQIHVTAAEGGSVRRLTDLAGGAAELAWSPNGRRLAFTTGVNLEGGPAAEPAQADDHPYIRYNRDVRTITRIRFKADGQGRGILGDIYRHAAVVTFDEQASGPAEVRRLSDGHYDLTSPVWSPDGTQLAVTGNTRYGGELGRQAFIYLLHADGPAPAAALELFGLEEMRKTNLAWSPDGSTIAVCGHDDPFLGHYGLQRVWLVDSVTGRGKCITRHLDVTFGDFSRDGDIRGAGDDGPRWLPDGSGLLVLVNDDCATHLCRLSLDGEFTPLTSGERVFSAFSADDAREQIVVVMADPVRHPDLYLLNVESSLLSSAQASGAPAAAPSENQLNKLTDVNGELRSEAAISPPVRFTFDSDDVTVTAWLVPPLQREPGRRYPLVIANGGGAGGMRTGLLSFQSQALAARDYAVLHCNARGNLGHGEAFSAISRGRWGEEDYRDNMNAIQAALQRFEYLDGERLAAFGSSYGGYMTNWMVSRHHEFGAAVSTNCLFNRFSFNGTADMGFLLDRVEFNHRFPWEKPDDFLARSPMSYIGNVRTPTLVIHSENDQRCPVDQGEQLFMALKRIGVPTEFIRFANEGHGIRQPWHRVYRLDCIIEWFDRWLG